MKKLFTLIAGLLCCSMAMAEVYSYSRYSDYSTEWTEISGGLARDGSVTGSEFVPVADLTTWNFQNFSKNFGGTWEAYGMGGHPDKHPTIFQAGTFFGARFQVADQVVTGVTLTNVDAVVGTGIEVQLLDDSGNVLESIIATGDDYDFSVSGFNSSYIDVVFKNVNTVGMNTWTTWGFGVDSMEITTAIPEQPATLGLYSVSLTGPIPPFPECVWMRNPTTASSNSPTLFRSSISKNRGRQMNQPDKNFRTKKTV